jgi:hypothetical protein
MSGEGRQAKHRRDRVEGSERAFNGRSRALHRKGGVLLCNLVSKVKAAAQKRNAMMSRELVI